MNNLKNLSITIITLIGLSACGSTQPHNDAGVAVGAANGALIGGTPSDASLDSEDKMIQQQEVLRRQQLELERQRRELEELRRQEQLNNSMNKYK